MLLLTVLAAVALLLKNCRVHSKLGRRHRRSRSLLAHGYILCTTCPDPSAAAAYIHLGMHGSSNTAAEFPQELFESIGRDNDPAYMSRQ